MRQAVQSSGMRHAAAGDEPWCQPWGRAQAHMLRSPSPPQPCPTQQDDPKYKAAMKVRNPERRLRAFTSVCQTKRTCEHTGGPQPTYRLEHGTLKIMAEFPKPKDDDDEAMAAMEAVERKQVRKRILRASVLAVVWLGGVGWVGLGWVGGRVGTKCSSMAWECMGHPCRRLWMHQGCTFHSPPPASVRPPPPTAPQEITPEKALEILRRISDDDCRALGFDPRYSRPDFMVLSVLPVPPPPVRPSVQMDSSSRYVWGGGEGGIRWAGVSSPG